MISRLKGKIVHLDPKYIVLDVNGVGYKVFITADILTSLNNEESEVILWTYQAIRENAMDLYGFPSLKELNFFELLITVSGIGPKTALGILNSAAVDIIEEAIQTNDTTHLVKVSGIGKKVSEKIVLELKDKIETIETSGSRMLQKNDSDVLEALKSLGYSHIEARDVLKEIPKTITKTSDKVKEALKILGK